MPTPSTYDDANLILRLYELRREDRMRSARKWYMEQFGPDTLDEFRKLCPPGTDTNASFRQVSSYYEMVASFVTGGVLNEELYFQSGGELFLVYIRLEPFLTELRNAFQNPGMYKNLEAIAKRYEAYINKNDPEASNAFRKRMRMVLGKA
ncbi:MAG TPA: DUF4760 domain-containing protein [Bryobacteraceae bacterium]|nr:DUF4760 domain-containing protein [Bryobacteraceae bacterium]